VNAAALWARLPLRAPAQLTTLVAALLLLLLAQALARLTWQLLPAPETPAAASPATPDSATDVAAPQRAATITDLHLFGSAAPLAASPDAPAPDTTLQLILRGLLHADDAKSARALIVTPDGNEDAYAIGDALPGEATLTQIRIDHVILRRLGRDETLRLPHEDGLLAEPGAAPAPVAGLAPGASLGAYRKALLANPASVLDMVRLVAVNRGGKMQGYRLMPGKDKTLLPKLGLNAGDLVTAVNGLPLEDQSRAAEVLSELANARQVNLTIKRGGLEQQVSLSMDQILEQNAGAPNANR
jgi:general secretion pathway protein C